MDLRAYIEGEKQKFPEENIFTPSFTLLPKERMMISTGLKMTLPEG